MQEVYLCLDVGGTEIKAAPLDKRGNFLAPVRHFPAMAGADRQTLLENFGWIFSSICPENAVPIEIDLAFPGPFDYKNGICLLQGLDKYDALYGCNLRRAFSEISGLLEQKFNSSMMQRPLRWGKWPLVRRRKPGERCLWQWEPAAAVHLG